MSSIIPGLVAEAGGKIAGKVRLQKIVYLLQAMGLGSKFSFEYRYYGPFSPELVDQVEEDVIFRRLKAVPERRQSDGVPYVVYENIDTVYESLRLDGSLSSALKEMQRVSATVLELAATIHWLAVYEKRLDWQEELVVRKGVKTENGRDKEALNLLRELKLPPAVALSSDSRSPSTSRAQFSF